MEFCAARRVLACMIFSNQVSDKDFLYALCICQTVLHVNRVRFLSRICFSSDSRQDILSKTMLGLYSQILVFANPLSIFCFVNAISNAILNIGQNSRLLINTIPKLSVIN